MIKFIQLVEGGHVFKEDPYEPGEPVYFEFEDYHGGYICIQCDEVECIHCHPEFPKSPCFKDV